MKIAISTQGPALSDAMDPRFGRAKFFVVVDSETGVGEAFNNSVNLNAAQGAGIQSAARVVELGAAAVITGHMGPKAFAALQAGGVAVYTGASGTAAEALEQFKASKLSKADGADVEGHWM
ncbi:MAG: dinitrogenase iron-molybdenum cofactor biosynthesis protein [Phycisphaerae bacterium]|nr:dinitrogenase iron-molybdenum cofactor biosynthesis protein [Phycisphaerae bacterium]